MHLTTFYKRRKVNDDDDEHSDYTQRKVKKFVTSDSVN